MSEKPSLFPEYDLRSVKLPHLIGWVLRLFVRLVEGPLQGLLAPSLLKSAGVSWLRRQVFRDHPTFLPIWYTDRPSAADVVIPREKWPQGEAAHGAGFRFPGVLDYARAYRDGQTTPVGIAEKVLAAIEKSESLEPQMRTFVAVNRVDVLGQAQLSAQRWKNGEPLSLLDGVPVAVKDEFDMLPYGTTVGTAFLGKAAATADAAIVTRMRSAGALLLGKCNMHEVGIGVTGYNATHGIPRNPYHVDHYTGGSSSGPAVAVASGLCPLALGADGGGSIRIPAAFCGVLGIKATFGRVSEQGAFPLTTSMGHSGPIAANIEDLVLGYAAIAGADARDPLSLHQPEPAIDGWYHADLKGLRLGIYPPWLEHADGEIVAACQKMIENFTEQGAEIVEISIPDLEAARIAHTITIASEIAQVLEPYTKEHSREHGRDVRINLALAGRFTSRDYLQAQRVRTRLMGHFAAALQKVDLILTPATAVVAPPIPPLAIPNGESDLTTLMKIMRFSTVANLTGLPAISFPVGYDADGLPIGMQAMAAAWQEPLLFRLARIAQGRLERRQPRVYFSILDEA